MSEKIKLPRKSKKVYCKIFSTIIMGCLRNPKPRKLTWREKQKYAKEIKDYENMHKEAYRQACIVTLGEDPFDPHDPFNDFDDDGEFLHQMLTSELESNLKDTD